MNNSILVVETGGTFATTSIGSVRTLNGNTEEAKIYDYDVVQERFQRYGMTYEVMRPIYTLSENMTFDKLNALLYALWSLDFSLYQGIIITHGTDTMAYTANLLSMLFGDRGIPIVLVSSNHPLSHVESNGVTNFISAIDFIHDVGKQGVYVIYRNHEGIIEVHLGSRIKQMNQIIDAYESFKNLLLGEMKDGKFCPYVNSLLPDLTQIENNQLGVYYQSFPRGKRVILISPYVGLRYDYFNIDESIDAIVCGVYHSGTVCVENNAIDQSINTLIERAEQYDIPVFIGELSSKNDHYASFKFIKDSPNVYPIYDISLENLYVKTHIALSTYKTAEEWVNYINNVNVFFEKVVV